MNSVSSRATSQPALSENEIRNLLSNINTCNQRIAVLEEQEKNGKILIANGNAKLERAKILEVSSATKIESGRAKIQSGQMMKDSGRIMQASGQMKIESGQMKIDSGRTMQESGRAMQASGQTKIESGQMKIGSGRSMQESGRAMQTSGQTKIESGQTKIESARVMQESGRAMQTSGQTKIESGQTKIESGQTKIESARVMQESGRAMQESARIKMEQVTAMREKECQVIYEEMDGAIEQLEDIKRHIEGVKENNEKGKILEELNCFIKRAVQLKAEAKPTASLTPVNEKINAFGEECNDLLTRLEKI